MLIDTHFHLDLMINMQALIREFLFEDVGIIAVGTTPKAYNRMKHFCSGVDNIWVGLGMHPQLIAEREQELELFLNIVEECRFIGEIGLDFSTNFIKSRDKQLSCFRKIIKACAHEGGKIISIHSVKATKFVVDELKSIGTFSNNICILHWFTGTEIERKEAIEAGAWFSINSNMLRTKGGQETIRNIPTDRILLETDAPFTVQPKTVYDIKRELDMLMNGICDIRGENIQIQINENYNRLFG